ncbi:MAG: LysR family transcriptional regulator, partial [Marinobacterium sp.]|nr:LysR family transcriptional regulator [Marinobacterium sp.]
MVRDIDISLIRAFLTVVESGGMTAAAHTLNLTQGAVSQKIQRLESLFEVSLFERRNRKLHLTPEGEQLLSRASRMVALNDETWQLMTRPAFAGEVRLGVPMDIVRPLMPAVMKRFSREYPQIQLTLVSDMTVRLLQSLRNGEIDLTLTTEDQSGKGGEALLSAPLIWVGAQEGDASRKTPLPVSLGSEACAFRRDCLQALNRAQLDWQLVCNGGNLEAIQATVEADMAVAPWMACLVP